MANWFYSIFFSLKLKRFMFCIICRMQPIDFYAVFSFFYEKIDKVVITNNDAYAFCKKHHIKGNYHTSGFHNIVTENEKIWLTEAYFLTKDMPNDRAIWRSEAVMSFHKYYHSIVYNQHPPLDKVATISWLEIISCYWKWFILNKRQKNIFNF